MHIYLHRHIFVMKRYSAGPSNYVVDLIVEIESKEDMIYVPLDKDESEDGALECEIDANIWLEDVKHPSNSRAPKTHR